MSVTSTTAAISHTGNGVADTFSFPFKVFAETDLYVTRYTIADGTLTALALTTDYTVSLTDSGASGGEVTLVAGPLSSDYKIIIQRLLSYTQETDLVENDPFSASTVEDSLDKLTMLTQQLKEELDRALLGSITTEDGVIAIGYDSGLPTIGATDADKIIQVNAGATDYELSTVAAAIQSTIDTSIDLHTFDEKTTIVDSDEIWIADSADSNTKKRVLFSTLSDTVSSSSKYQVFTSDGNFTAPVGVTKVYLSGCGGGGGGGAAAGQAASTAGGGGGASGRWVVNYPYTVVPGNTYAVVIGTGGAGGTGVNNAQGGTGATGVATTFDGTVSISGGLGGVGGTGTTAGALGGSEFNGALLGVSSPGDVGKTSDPGATGGATPWGPGGAGGTNDVGGNAAVYGGGGGGARASHGGTPVVGESGGNGAKGILIVSW